MYRLLVYLDDGRVFRYLVDTESAVREHSAAIARDGYRHNDGNVFEHYPSHRILKIKCKAAISTDYPDETLGT